MFTDSFKEFITQQRVKRASTLPWVFYGWTIGITISLCVIGYILFILYKEVYFTLQTTGSTITNQAAARPLTINFSLYQKTKQLWEAKKELPLKNSSLGNPFSQKQN